MILLHTGNPCRLGQGLLPPLVNSSSLDESRPAFTPDGRYIGFIRDETSGHERLYVFDTETQTLLDSDGQDLGLVATRTPAAWACTRSSCSGSRRARARRSAQARALPVHRARAHAPRQGATSASRG